MNPLLFADVPFDSHEGWEAFSRDHLVSHQHSYLRLTEAGKKPTYSPLGDFPRQDNANYLNDHQQVHSANFRGFGISGLPDLSSADFNNQEQYYDWIQQHAQVHAAEDGASLIEQAGPVVAIQWINDAATALPWANDGGIIVAWSS